MRSRFFLLSGLVLGVLAVAPAALLPLSQIDAPPGLALLNVSPDGRTLALRAEIEGKQYLATAALADMQLKLVAEFPTTRLRNIFWKSSDLMLLIVANSDGASEFRSFDLKTQQAHFLSDRVAFSEATLRSMLMDDPESVVLQISSANGVYLAKLNVRSGQLDVMQKAESEVLEWFVTARGEPVAALCSRDKRVLLRWRPSSDAPWRETDLEDAEWHARRIFPFGVHRDGRRLLAWDKSSEGTRSLVALDPATLQKEVLFQHPSVDVDSVEYWGDDPAIMTAVRYEDDRPRYHHLAPDAQVLQATIDTALPDTFNEVVSLSLDRSVAAILARSDRDPGTYYLLDRTKRQLRLFAPAYQEIHPPEMGRSRPFTFPTKDGWTIRGRILLPPGEPPSAPVLLLIGDELAGPRSRYGFNAVQQAFATRGFAVVSIDHRGIWGFGRKFEAAGDYQFHRAILDDLNAGLDFVVSQGWVDGAKVGLVTTGRGGVIGLQWLLQSKRAKVWLNYGTRVTGNPLEIEELALSPKKESEILADLGGRSAARDMIRLLDVRRMLPQVTVPSFHLYHVGISETIGANGNLLKSQLKSSPAPEIVVFHGWSDHAKAKAEKQEAFSRMFRFLNDQLPPAAQPR